ncbi:MAG: dephospho-CoA kinase [Candidatus Gastranaerophilaceae bacterium]
MLKIGITGNIAAGKSTVEKMLEEMGYKVLNADDVAHDLLFEDYVKKQIMDAFADYDILKKGELSRPKLGKIIFTNEKHRKTLEGILHPLIREGIIQFFKSMEKREEIVFVSVPLLFEAKFDDLFDKIVLIYADDEIRIQRLIERSDLTESMAKNRLNIQMSQDKKKPLSAHIIFNNGSLDDLRLQVDNLRDL